MNFKQQTLSFFKRKREEPVPEEEKKEEQTPKKVKPDEPKPKPSSPKDKKPAEKTPEKKEPAKKQTKPTKEKKEKKTSRKKKVVEEDEEKSDAEEEEENNDADRWKWLEPQNLRDADGNRPGDEKYDPRTVFIPSNDYHNMTAMERQYWDIKRKYFDSIIFFKKGKFYELYEGDADIATRVFDMKLTDRINMRMCGFPESSLNVWSAKFIAKGYKIGRVEQIESVIDAKKRVKTTKSKNSCVERELRQIVTSGTLVDGEIIGSPASNYLLAIKEDLNSHSYGFVFVDCSIGKFTLGDIKEDPQRTNFETLIQSLAPKEVIIEKGNLSRQSNLVLKGLSNTPLITQRKTLVEFWDEESTKKNYSNHWKTLPTEIQNLKNPLTISALGAMISYLEELKLDELLDQSNFESYKQGDMSHMILDGQTLINLEIFVNNLDGGRNGTLFNLLDNCITPFGKRLFHEWICHPLKSIAKIEERLEAIDELKNNESLTCLTSLSKLPDLERMISRIHAGGRNQKNAIYFGDQDAKKMKLLINTIQGFQSLQNLFKSIEKANCKSKLFNHWIKEVPDLAILEDFTFDFEKALENGYILPKRGQNKQYDDVTDKEKQIEEKLEEILASAKKKLKCKEVKYFGKLKDRFQIDVPNDYKGNVPSDWIKMSVTKKNTRYHTKEIQQLLQELIETEENRDNLLREGTRKLFSDFDQEYKIWSKTLSIVAQIDCLRSLSIVSSMDGMCRPKFVASSTPFLDLKQMKHPFMTLCNQSSEVIPNDTRIGKGDVPRCLILTGPNMGGKSTLLRQTCIAIIMAQLGCWIPAESCEMTVVDRIFTRIGANDKIMSNQSTFMVELSETSNILHNATKDSFVILDELGRGTSTFDGYAIAYATIRYLAEKINCRTLFSTHYYLLTEEFANHPLVDMYHMKCHVEDGNVSFLYQFEKGICQKSYGLNVAKLAGIPQEVIDEAQIAAEELEKKQEWEKPTLNSDQIKLYHELTNYVSNEEGIKKKILMEYQTKIKNSFCLEWDQ